MSIHQIPDRRGFVYMLTNPKKTVLYVGVTNNIYRRLLEHLADCESGKSSFVARYHYHRLVYYEIHERFTGAIAREKQLKGWTRAKKEALINDSNSNWDFLNDRPEVKFMWKDL